MKALDVELRLVELAAAVRPGPDVLLFDEEVLWIDAETFVAEMFSGDGAELDAVGCLVDDLDVYFDLDDVELDVELAVSVVVEHHLFDV